MAIIVPPEAPAAPPPLDDDGVGEDEPEGAVPPELVGAGPAEELALGLVLVPSLLEEAGVLLLDPQPSATTSGNAAVSIALEPIETSRTRVGTPLVAPNASPTQPTRRALH
jgi:hypothetical protein